ACRLFVVSLGHPKDASTLGVLARAGRGSVFRVGRGEDPERAAAQLVAHTASPLIMDLELSGSALVARAPERALDVYAGAVSQLALKLRVEGGELFLRGRTGKGVWEDRLSIARAEPGHGSSAVSSLFGRECALDLEMRVASGEPRESLDAQIERLGC